MKKCPYCAESIQDEAIKCRYCGERLEMASQNVPKKDDHQTNGLACLGAGVLLTLWAPLELSLKMHPLVPLVAGMLISIGLPCTIFGNPSKLSDAKLLGFLAVGLIGLILGLEFTILAGHPKIFMRPS